MDLRVLRFTPVVAREGPPDLRVLRFTPVVAREGPLDLRDQAGSAK